MSSPKSERFSLSLHYPQLVRDAAAKGLRLERHGTKQFGYKFVLYSVDKDGTETAYRTSSLGIINIKIRAVVTPENKSEASDLGQWNFGTE